MIKLKSINLSYYIISKVKNLYGILQKGQILTLLFFNKKPIFIVKSVKNRIYCSQFQKVLFDITKVFRRYGRNCTWIILSFLSNKNLHFLLSSCLSENYITTIMYRYEFDENFITGNSKVVLNLDNPLIYIILKLYNIR